MKTAWRRKLNHNHFDTSLVKIYQVLIILCPQKWKVHICIVAVNSIDHTDWLDIMVDDLNHLSPHVLIFFRNPILLISQCMGMNRWLSLHFIYIPQLPNLDRYYLEFAFLHQAYQEDNIADLPLISQCWKSENFSTRDTFMKLTFLKLHIFGVTITTCSFPHIGKSN